MRLTAQSYHGPMAADLVQSMAAQLSQGVSTQMARGSIYATELPVCSTAAGNVAEGAVCGRIWVRVRAAKDKLRVGRGRTQQLGQHKYIMPLVQA